MSDGWQSARFWVGMIAVNVAAALLATVAFSGLTWHTPWRQIGEAAGVSFLFSICCSTPCIVALPRLVPYTNRRLPFPLNWIVIAAALVLFAAGGSLTATFVLGVMGYLPLTRVIAAWLAGPLNISIIVTLLFGLFGTGVEVLRARLDATTLALRTKERDEADARRMAAESQLASLEARVQPHFLFNTLNSIAALIHEDPAGAERMTTQLGALMRSSLASRSRTAALVPLDEELRLVRAYLDIERVRFGARLRYTIDVDPITVEAPVPRFSLQTLVENSVKYAVSTRRDGATVVVRSRAASDRLRLEVEDDGPGFARDDVVDGHGIALLQARLTMLFDDRAALDIASAAGRTVISIDLPRS